VATATFTDGHTQAVTNLGTWHSSNPTVATVVVNTGVVSGLAVGTTSITFSYQNEAGTIDLSVATGQITACGTYAGAGPFVVTRDLTSPTVSCLTFSNNVSAQLDCQGHDVSSVALSGVHSFTIQNCLMHFGAAQSLKVLHSGQVMVTASDVRGQVYTLDCQDCTFTGNTFQYPAATPCVAGPVVINDELQLAEDPDVVVTGNTIDAGWDGNFPTNVGCDDAVGLADTQNSRIQGNVIRNAWDAGIESGAVNTPMVTTIQDNTFSQLGVAAIGSYYAAGWQNSVFSRNTASNSPQFLRFELDKGGTPITALTLVNNQFNGNIFVPPPVDNPTPTVTINFQASGIPVTVSGNVFANNNLGAQRPGPQLLPAQGFIDGGGNLCGPGSNVLLCGGPLDSSGVSHRAVWTLLTKAPTLGRTATRARR
jgi:hypothetical protein